MTWNSLTDCLLRDPSLNTDNFRRRSKRFRFLTRPCIFSGSASEIFLLIGYINLRFTYLLTYLLAEKQRIAIVSLIHSALRVQITHQVTHHCRSRPHQKGDWLSLSRSIAKTWLWMTHQFMLFPQLFKSIFLNEFTVQWCWWYNFSI